MRVSTGESAQKIQGMQSTRIHYEKRLHLSDLHWLERRRLREDLIYLDIYWYEGYKQGDIVEIYGSYAFKFHSRLFKKLGRNEFSDRVV